MTLAPGRPDLAPINTRHQQTWSSRDGSGRDLLDADLADLVSRHDRQRDGGSVAIESRYLESVLTLR